ncbi:MAG: hypothetical protein G3M70_06455 [Candidatus Nitronauta litoralis]|uniref:Uncharacterized protein n=1 Tax=Candidatus Nitronauta litoralis TaxID=2705533 RepID=A0A7T0G077_9BACT|nr:MAG: hypothetical protein G3M70_06455 [Candidatus Nitronauta litoralis]
MAKKIFSLIEQLDSFATKHNLDLSTENGIKKLPSILEKETREIRNSPTFVYGKRTENIFFEMVKELKAVALIQKLDEEKYFSADNIQIPDFKIILKNGEKYFIEVKNFSPKTQNKNVKTFQYSFTKSYISKIKTYSKITGSPIKIAIYWKKLGKWSLNNLGDFKLQRGKYTLEMSVAFEKNHMFELGDKAVATTSPLIFRIKIKPENLNINRKNEKVSAKITGIYLVSTEGIIRNKEIERLAFYLFWFGTWKSPKEELLITNGNLVGWDYISVPEEKITDQPFQIIAYLSDLYTNIFFFQTEGQSNLPKMTSLKGLPSLDKILPNEPFNKGLPLWVFEITPKQS